MRILRWMMRITPREGQQNEVIMRRTWVMMIGEKRREARLRCYCLFVRREDKTRMCGGKPG